MDGGKVEKRLVKGRSTKGKRLRKAEKRDMDRGNVKNRLDRGRKETDEDKRRKKMVR